MTDTERTFGVLVLKKSLIGQSKAPRWKNRKYDCYPPPNQDDDIPVIERINKELEKNGSHS